MTGRDGKKDVKKQGGCAKERENILQERIDYRENEGKY